uniref:Uncharacterized protein n=1 Tax=Arion vulgaris TaxID=1028688 RepID=A0A0B6Z5B6_9EUPU
MNTSMLKQGRGVVPATKQDGLPLCLNLFTNFICRTVKRDLKFKTCYPEDCNHLNMLLWMYYPWIQPTLQVKNVGLKM